MRNAPILSCVGSVNDRYDALVIEWIERTHIADDTVALSQQHAHLGLSSVCALAEGVMEVDMQAVIRLVVVDDQYSKKGVDRLAEARQVLFLK